MFYYCGIVSMRYLLTDYLGEHSNNHIISAILRCLVLLRLIEAIISVVDLPLPIPNREVKPERADGTAMRCGE